MDEPTASIGLPVYNGERFLARAIDSVLAQTYEDWELLISDNGSADATVAIAQQYADRDPRIRLRVNDRNMGAVANFESVFQETTGRYFMWLAHDDWFDASYLDRCVQVLEDRPDFVMAFAGLNVVDDTGQPTKHKTESIDGATSKNVIARFHTILWHLRDPTSPVFGVARRSALEQTGLIRNSNEPDRILIGELSLLGGIHQDPDLLFYHYHRPPRDSWEWLDPRNRGHRRFATFRIVSHQWNAIWRGDHGLIAKLVMTVDLVIASLVTRTKGKANAIKRQLSSSRR